MTVKDILILAFKCGLLMGLGLEVAVGVGFVIVAIVDRIRTKK